LFFIQAYDDPARPGHRQAVRPRHLPLLIEACRSGRIRFAGPILDAPGGQPVGSLIVLDVDSRDAVDAWLATEPFFTDGVWKDITVLPCGIAPMPYVPLPGPA
jgi:hypothetical protein